MNGEVDSPWIEFEDRSQSLNKLQAFAFQTKKRNVRGKLISTSRPVTGYKLTKNSMDFTHVEPHALAPGHFLVVDFMSVFKKDKDRHTASQTFVYKVLWQESLYLIEAEELEKAAKKG
jgi:hypothetical protein